MGDEERIFSFISSRNNFSSNEIFIEKKLNIVIIVETTETKFIMWEQVLP